MAYNNGFPVTYPQMYYTPQYQPAQQTQQAQQTSNPIIWVSGEAGAKAYLVAPNNSIVLFDSESQSIYIKSADASGMPSMKILDYTIRDQTPGNGPVTAPTNAVDYATKSDIKALTEQIDELRDELDSMTYRRPMKPRKDDDDE